MVNQRIEQWFENHRQRLVDDVCRMVRVKSVGGGPAGDLPYGEGPAAALREAISVAGEMGFSMRDIGHYVGEADLNGGPLELGILAHLDVVPEGSGWSTEPYSPVVRDGKIFGRGTADNKGPAMAALYAMACARELFPELTKNARLILGTDEERGSSDLKYYFGAHGAPVPPKSFTPDAFFPVINTEKGGFAPVFGAEWADDKTLPRVVRIEGGHTGNAVPRQAEALTEGLDAGAIRSAAKDWAERTGVTFTVEESKERLVKVTACGASAHAAMPHLGNNAQTALIGLLAGLPMAPGRGFAVIRGLSEMFPHGDFYGEAAGVKMEDFSGPLTLNFGILSYTATGFRGAFDSRVPVCANRENMADVIKARFESLGIAILEKVEMRPAHHTPEDSELVKTLLRVYEQYTGQKGYCVAIGGGTYAHDLPGAVAYGLKLPGENCNSHGADEFTLIDRLIRGGMMIAQVIADLCR